MKYMKRLLHRYGERKTGMILMFFGVIIGVLFSKIFKKIYWDELDLLNINYFSLIKTMDIDYKKLRNYVLWKDFKNFLLLWALCFTKIGINYIVFILLYYGFQIGFFTSVIFMGYGLKGILLIIGYTIPQIIIYLPVIFLSIKGGYWLCKNLYFDGIHSKRRLETISKYLVFIVILGFLLFIGALLETYVGSVLLKKILSAF